MSRAVLVTGGGGFIGTNFIRLLLTQQAGWSVINLDKLTYAANPEAARAFEGRPDYAFVQGDICDRELVEALFRRPGDFLPGAAAIEAVVNFAAESHVDRSILEPGAFVRTNVVGTFTLLEMARQAWAGAAQGRRFVQISTDEVYGSLGPEGSFKESYPYRPNSPYSASKAAADHLARAYGQTWGLPINVVNSSNNFGPYQFPEKLIPLTIHRALREEPVPIYGDGRNVRDWLYVEDNCVAIALVLARGRVGETYHIGSGNEWANIDLVRLLLEVLGERVGRPGLDKLITFVKDRPGHDRRYAIDAAKLRSELGWRPAHSFRDALGATIDWYLAHPEFFARLGEDYRDYLAEQYRFPELAGEG